MNRSERVEWVIRFLLFALAIVLGVFLILSFLDATSLKSNVNPDCIRYVLYIIKLINSYLPSERLHMNKTKQTGFSIVEALLILVVIGILGFTGWYVYHSKRVNDKSY